MRISAIIPAWCEAAGIADAVACAREIADEVIVVDAHSPDGTAAKAAEAGARVIHADYRGRGAQLAAGANAAQGETLLFLHADARLPAAARAAIEAALEDEATSGGNFALRFVPETFSARLFTWANHVRRRWLRIYYGDSAIFVRRSVYRAIGGFAQIPLMEDHDLVRRLERHGRTAYVTRVEVRVSGRRFARAPLRTLLVWAIVQGLYTLGVPPARLVRLYADLR